MRIGDADPERPAVWQTAGTGDIAGSVNQYAADALAENAASARCAAQPLTYPDGSRPRAWPTD